MFDIGFAEIFFLAVITLLVVGPKRLPETVKTIARTLAKFRHNWSSVRREIEKEIGMDEIRREIHNEQVMKDLAKIKQQVSTDISVEQASDDPKYDPHDYEREPMVPVSAEPKSDPVSEPEPTETSTPEEKQKEQPQTQADLLEDAPPEVDQENSNTIHRPTSDEEPKPKPDE